MKIDLRLAIPVVAAWVAVGVLIGFPSVLAPAAVILWVIAIGLTGVALLAHSGLRGVVAGLALLVGVAALLVSIAGVRQSERQPAVLLEAASAGRYVTATARTDQTILAGSTRFSATLTSVSIGTTERSGAIPVIVFFATGSTARTPLGIATTVTLSGTLKATTAGDETAFLFFSARAPTVSGQPPPILDWANTLRSGFHAAAARLPGTGGDLLPGLAIGDTSAVGLALSTAMKATSLSHLTAVSGANCAVVIALILLAGAALGVPRGVRVGASIVILAGFVVLVTPQPSVLRAAVMAALVLGAMLGGRPMRGVPTLALASLVLLAIDPWLSRSYGFILSVLATGGLLVLSGPLTRVLQRWLPLWLSALLAIPLAAQLACQPVLILLNPSIPTYGVVANMLAEPAAPVATVLGLVSCVLLPVVPAVGQLVAWLAWLPSAWIAAVALFFSGLPGSSVPWPGGAVGVVATSAVVALLLAVLLLPPERGRRMRRLAASTLVLLLVGYLGLAAGDAIRVQLTRPSDWQIAACDIGQGDAVLVRSLGKVALIDTGPDPKLLTRCLSQLGIGHIDLLVLTHYDMDHVGGTSAVFGKVGVAMVGPSDGSPAVRFATELADNGAAVSAASQGMTGRLGDLGWEVLWPPAKLGSVQPGNDASIALRFTGVGACQSGCLSAVFLADLGAEPQANVLAANTIGRVDVVKVAHHGSADQNPLMYARLRATVGVVSVGIDNSYGHPTGKLLAILAQNNTIVTRTDLEGMTLLSPRPDGTVSVWTEHPLPAGKVLVH